MFFVVCFFTNTSLYAFLVDVCMCVCVDDDDVCEGKWYAGWMLVLSLDTNRKGGGRKVAKEQRTQEQEGYTTLHCTYIHTHTRTQNDVCCWGERRAVLRGSATSSLGTHNGVEHKKWNGKKKKRSLLLLGKEAERGSFWGDRRLFVVP